MESAKVRTVLKTLSTVGSERSGLIAFKPLGDAPNARPAQSRNFASQGALGKLMVAVAADGPVHLPTRVRPSRRAPPLPSVEEGWGRVLERPVGLPRWMRLHDLRGEQDRRTAWF